MFAWFNRSETAEFTYAQESSAAIEQISAAMGARIEAHGFVLLCVYPYHEIVAEKGFKIDRKVYIYEVCQAKTAARMLKYSPDFAPFMPCRIGVYETDEGKVRVAIPAMEAMLAQIEHTELASEAKALYKRLQNIVKESV